MPLTGEAKKEYQRGYMQRYRQPVAKAKAQIRHAVESSRVLKGLSSLVSQEVLRSQLDKADLGIDVTLRRVKQLHDAERPYGKDAILGPDNDARARGCELALRLHERAGSIPSAVAQGPGGASITLIEVNYHAAPQDVVVDADNTEPLAIEGVEVIDTPIDSTG